MSLDALVDGLFDYAGMFPPAELEFDDALRTTATFKETLARPQLVGNDIVLTPKKLPALDDEVLERTGWAEGATFRVCLVGVPLVQAETTAEGVRRFNEDRRRGPIPQRITSLEVTTDATESLEKLAGPLDRARAGLDRDTRLYVEPRWQDAQWKNLQRPLFALMEAMAASGEPVGLKVRCAGSTELSRETLASLVPDIVAARIPFKATQGLHHPVLEPRRLGNEHGFVNLSAALWLRTALGEAFAPTDIFECLGTEDPSSFGFEQGLAWKEHQIDAAALRSAKERTPVAIGSCDLHEPDEDLLRLFPAAAITQRP